jgi:Ca-activated chloride channel family protein
MILCKELRRIMMNHYFTIFALVIAWFSQAWSVGTLYVRPLNSDQQHRQVSIQTVDADIDIQGQVAVTHVDQVFLNEMSTTVEAVWIFPLPKGAVVTELFYWFNGKRYKAEIRERQEARQEYEQRIRRRLDPALLEYLGDNLFRLSIAPINSRTEVRTEITYTELLPYEFGSIDYRFMLDASKLSPRPLDRVSTSIQLSTEHGISRVKLPNHEQSPTATITRITSTRYRIMYGDESFMPDKDLILEYEIDRPDLGVNLLTYTPFHGEEIGDESFYAIWITPPDALSGSTTIPQKIVFTADISSSMEGERIRQLKQALLEFLEQLRPDDEFNIVLFSTGIQSFKEDFVPVNQENLNKAKTFVQAIGAAGLTNIEQAFDVALEHDFSQGHANAIVFLTDGYPTWGTTDLQQILERVNAECPNHVRIFTFGIGGEVSEALLSQLASQNGGTFYQIHQDRDISQMVSAHFKRLSRPALTQLDIDFSNLVVSDVYPSPLPDLFYGNQVMQLGRYENGGTVNVKLTGLVKEQPFKLATQKHFGTVSGGHPFIPRLWARQKIDYLLDQIKIYGEKSELVNQVIDLSLKFQILTEYTAFYSDPTGVHNEQSVPKEFVLYPNYPNPFNPATTLEFNIPQEGKVLVQIFDLSGRLVKTLVYAHFRTGRHTVQWDGTNTAGQRVASGVYLAQVQWIAPNGSRYLRSLKLSLLK